MNKEQKTAIYLDFKEAELFLKFRKYQYYWEKIFQIKDGSAEIHFDELGEIRRVWYHTSDKC